MLNQRNIIKFILTNNIEELYPIFHVMFYVQ